jgi:hypothetical protein
MKSTTSGSTINITPAFMLDFQSRIVRLLNTKNGEWNGTMTQLSYALTRSIKRAVPAYWPSSPSVMRRVVNTVLPRLRNAGVSVSFGRATDRVRTRIVSFVK